MKRTLLFWAAGFLLVAVGWRVVEACSCDYQHPQDQYCSAGFVIYGIPRGVKLDNGTIVYTVELRSPIKLGREAKKAFRSGRIYTPDDSCAITLTMNITHLITGYIKNGKPYADFCGFVKPYKDMTDIQREGFANSYRYACNCDICTDPSTCVKTRRNCLYVAYSNIVDCYANYGICTRNSRGHCNWVQNKGRLYPGRKLTQCLSNQTVT